MKARTKHFFGVIVILGVVSGGALLFLADGNDRVQSDKEQTTGTASNELSFNAQPTAETAFVATVEGEVDDEPIEATIEYDGGGSTRFTSKHEGEKQEVIITPSAAYSCSGDECTRFEDAGAANPLFNPGDYIYTEEEVQSIEKSAIYVGEKECPDDICHVWELHNETTTEISNIYVSKNNKLISQISGTSKNSEYTVIYKYQDVTITVPTDAASMPTF